MTDGGKEERKIRKEMDLQSILQNNQPDINDSAAAAA